MSRFGTELHRFVDELRRRHVVRVATAYAVAAFVVLQAADLIFEGLLVPSWIYRALVVVVLLGFPLVLVLAWLYEWTSQGIQREADGSVSAPGRTLAFVGLGTVIALVGMGLTVPVMYAGRDGAPAPAGEQSGAAAAGDGPADAEGVFRASRLAQGAASIAVLPFANLTADGDTHFGDGLAEDVLAGLAQIDGLQVVSRTSTLGYRGTEKPARQIGAELGVGLILEGSIRRSGDMVRVTAQLIDARTDTHLWASTYDRDATDVFGVQSELAREIVAAVHAALAPEQLDLAERRLAVGLQNEMGQDLLREGDEFSDRQASAVFRGALDVDSNAAPSHAGLSLALVPEALGDPETMRIAKWHAERALDLDADLADAHAARAFVFVVQGEVDSARVALWKAARLTGDTAFAAEWRTRLERIAEAGTGTVRVQPLIEIIEEMRQEQVAEPPAATGARATPPAGRG